MIITISGLPGSGKSTISKLLAKKLKLKRYALGKIFREEASKHKVDNLTLLKLAEFKPSINKLIDKKIKNMIGKTKNFILDSRLSALLYKKADYHLYLYAPITIRAKRIALRDKVDYEEALQKTRLRESLERKLYKKQYKFDYINKKHYNVILDTSKCLPEGCVNIIINKIKQLK